MNLRDLRAIAHISLNRDDLYSRFAAWEKWTQQDLDADIVALIKSYVADSRFDSIANRRHWLFHSLTPVFWVKRGVFHWLCDRELAPFQIAYKLRRLNRGA